MRNFVNTINLEMRNFSESNIRQFIAECINSIPYFSNDMLAQYDTFHNVPDLIIIFQGYEKSDTL